MPELTDSSNNKAPAALDQFGTTSGGVGGSVLRSKTPPPLHPHTLLPAPEWQGHPVPRSCENELGDLYGITVHGAGAGILLI